MDKIKVPDIDVGNLDRFIQNAFNDLKNDDTVFKHIQTLKISDETIKSNIASFLEFQEDIHYCSKCPGVSKCGKERPHFQLRLSFDGKFLERAYAPCEKILEKWEQDVQYPLCDFPIAMRDLSFDKMIETKGRLECEIFVSNLNNPEKKKWLYISGNQPKTKTFYAIATLNALIKEKRGPGIYLNTQNRLKELADMSVTEKENFRKTIDLYTNVPVLIFEDFGNEYKNDYVRDTILFPILFERARNAKITIFTSDFKYNEIVRLYGITDSGRIRSNQLASLLHSMCKKPIEVNGIDVY